MKFIKQYGIWIVQYDVKLKHLVKQRKYLKQNVMSIFNYNMSEMVWEY